MIVIKWSKTRKAAFTSHVDMMRAFMCLFRRARLDVAFTQGFNPHMDMCFSPALSLGVWSECEYLYYSGEFSSDILDKLNVQSFSGVKFEKVWVVEKVKLASDVTKARYEVVSKGIANAVKFLDKDFCIDKKGELIAVADKIKDCKIVGDDKIILDLDCGNSNLRCDKVVQRLLALSKSDEDYCIVKTQMFVKEVEVDAYLDSLTI